MPFKALLGLRVRGIAVEDGADYLERLTGKVPIEALTPTNLIFSKDPRSHRMEMATARMLSVPLAVVAIALLAPLVALVALAIKLDSPGPVFFVQSRVGRGGRPFRLIKFRTMRPATGATSEWVRDNRGRLTRVGRWLRRFRLDELPQFLNVVMGDMNLVGPRPHPVCNVSMLALAARNTPECGEQIPFYALRSLVRPGLTGWAQVRYQYANDLDEEIEKMRYDLYYIRHRSFWLDLRVLLETVRIVLLGRESDGYGRRADDSAGTARTGRSPLRPPASADSLGAPLAVGATAVAPPVSIAAIPIVRPDGQRAIRA
jgi:lipopolysaccharide/colanic/teichoic acid biosynthesis glycosyltransferase